MQMLGEEHPDTLTSMSMLADLASGSRDHIVRLWDAATRATLRTLEGQLGWVDAVAFSPGETNHEETNGMHICPFL